MTDSLTDFEARLRRMVRYWPIVLVAVLVTAALGVGLAVVRAPKTSYQATVPVRLVNFGGNPKATSPDGVVAAAISPEAKAAVIASLGPDAGVGIGTVSAAVDTRDSSLVRIVVAGTNSEKTKVFADSLARVAVSLNRQLVQAPISTYEEMASHDASAMARFDELVAKLEAQARSTPNDVALQGLIFSAQAQRDSYFDQQRINQFTASLWRGTASYPSPATVARASRRGAYITAGLQGAIIGLIIGLAVAGVVTQRRRRVEG